MSKAKNSQTNKDKKDGGGAPLPQSGRITLATVAEAAGVSNMTVSYALRNEPGVGRIAEETAARIRKIAKQLNYVPNSMAQSLRRQHTHIIGVVLADLRMDWSQRVLNGLEEVFDPASYQPMLMLHQWSVERNRRELRSLLERRVDAIVSQPLAAMADEYKEIIPPTLPHVFISDRPVGDDTAAVVWDDGHATRQIIKHLADTGRKRIALVGVKTGTMSSRRRAQSYRQALKAAHLEVDPELEVWVDAAPSGVGDSIPLDKLLDRARSPVDAIFAMNDALAIDVMHQLRKRGLRIPEDIAVAGLGDLPVAANQAAGLTTVVEPCREMGAAAGRYLLQILGGGEDTRTQIKIPAGPIRLRRSTLPVSPVTNNPPVAPI